MSSFVSLEDVKKIYQMGEVQIMAAAGIDFQIEKGRPTARRQHSASTNVPMMPRITSVWPMAMPIATILLKLAT